MKRIIIITGASSGLGAEFARQVYAEKSSIGTEMWLIAREADKLNAFAKTLTGRNIAIKTFAFDLGGATGAEHVRKILDTERKTGEFVVELLINNAGFGTYGPFVETDPEREMTMIDLNCTALTGICGFVLPHMQRGGRIINVASLAAFLPLGNFAVYAATKAYVLSFSVALAAELKERGISVCALCPGSVSTNFAKDEHLAVVFHHFLVTALLAGKEDAELGTVAAGDVELSVGQCPVQLGQAAVLLYQPVDGRAVHSHLAPFQSRRHLVLA